MPLASSHAQIEDLLKLLQQLLVGISIMQELTPRTKDSLVSFGERLSTRLFASYLNEHGVPAKQHDAFQMGVVTNDNFTNAGGWVGGWVGDFLTKDPNRLQTQSFHLRTHPIRSTLAHSSCRGEL